MITPDYILVHMYYRAEYINFLPVSYANGGQKYISVRRTVSVISMELRANQLYDIYKRRNVST